MWHNFSRLIKTTRVTFSRKNTVFSQKELIALNLLWEKGKIIRHTTCVNGNEYYRVILAVLLIVLQLFLQGKKRRQYLHNN